MACRNKAGECRDNREEERDAGKNERIADPESEGEDRDQAKAGRSDQPSNGITKIIHGIFA